MEQTDISKIERGKEKPVVYATKSPIGLRTMKEAMHTGLNASDLPEDARDAIRNELERPVEQIIDELLDSFSGQVVPWVGNDPTESVRAYLLENTLVFPWQFAAVKAEIAEYRRRGRADVYEFPTKES